MNAGTRRHGRARTGTDGHGRVSLAVGLALALAGAAAGAPTYVKTGTNTVIGTAAATNVLTTVNGALSSVEIGVTAGSTADVSVVGADGAVLLGIAAVTTNSQGVYRPRVAPHTTAGVSLAPSNVWGAVEHYGNVTCLWTGVSAGITNAVRVRLIYSR